MFKATKKIVTLLCLFCLVCSVDAKTKDKVSNADLPSIKTQGVELTLPKEFYGVRGMKNSLFTDNVILTQSPDLYKLSIKPKLGAVKGGGGYWLGPAKNKKNERRLTISIIKKGKSKVVEKQKIKLLTAPSSAGKGEKLRLLIVGDSLTAGGQYPAEIARLLSGKGNPAWTMFGSQKKEGGVAYEGYGGWRWSSYSKKIVKNSVHFTKKGTSPFVFPDKKGHYGLDVQRYFREQCNGEKPNVITILLGINDCFSFQKYLPNREKVESNIGDVLKGAEKLISEFKKAAPKAIIGICLTTPPNSRQSAFYANYKNAYHRWTWKQVQHLLVRAQIKHFENRQKENIYVIPTTLNIDPVEGYPERNGVHPNGVGYRQIGSTIYSWLKWQFHQKKIKQ